MIYSIEAEQAVIGACLIDQSSLERIGDELTADDFYQPSHRLAYSKISDLNNHNQPVDIITLGEAVENDGSQFDLGYFTDLTQKTPSSANVKHYAKIVKEYAKKRALVNVLSYCSDQATSGTSTSDELLANAAAMIGALQVSDNNETRDVPAIMKSLIQMWDRRMNSNGEMDGLTTGLKALDNRFNGWKPGDLVIIAGRPGTGKSALSLQIALHNATSYNKNVKLFSLEMVGEPILERCVANLAKVKLEVFKKGDSEKFGQFSHEISFAVGKIKQAPIYIDETPGLHINQILARARATHRKTQLSLLVIDHINLVKADGDSAAERMSQISSSLKNLAKELGCPVIAVTQLNRKVEERINKRPIMSDLRGGGSIEEDADIVILLYRDEYYNPDSPDKGIIEINTGKFREGEPGMDLCASKLDMGRIEDLAPGYMRQEPEPQAKSFRDRYKK